MADLQQQLIWLGAGSAAAPALDFANFSNVTLIDARAEATQALTRQYSQANNVQVVTQAVAASSAAASLQHYNLAAFAALTPATGLAQLFPGLKASQTENLTTKTITELLSELALTGNQHTLVLDIPDQALSLLQALQSRQQLSLFTTIYLQYSNDELYAGMAPFSQLEAFFKQHYFTLKQTDNTDPDLPVYCFILDAAAKDVALLKQQLKTLTEKLASAEGQLSQAQQQAASEKKHAEQAKAELTKQLEQAKQQAAAEQQQAEQTKAELTKQLEQAKQQAAAEQQQAEQTKAELTKQLEQAKQQAAAEKQQAEQTKAELTKQLEQAKQQAAAEKQQAEQAKAELTKQLEQAKQEAASEQKQAEQTKAELTKQLEQAKQQAAAEKQQAEQTKAELTKQLEQAKQQATAEKQQTEQTKAELAKQLEQAKQQATAEKQQAEQTKTELTKQLEQAKQQATAEKQQAEQTKAELTKQFDQLKQQAEENNKKNQQQALEQKYQFEQKLAELNTLLVNNVSENETLQQQLTAVKVAAEKTQAELTGQLAGKDAELKQALQKLATAEQHLSSVNEQLTQQKQALALVKQQLDDSLAQHAATTEQLAKVESWLEHRKKQTEALESELAAMKAENALLKSQQVTKGAMTELQANIESLFKQQALQLQQAANALGQHVSKTQYEQESNLQNVLALQQFWQHGEQPLTLNAWSIQADTLNALIKQLNSDSYDLIIEFGSGDSTVVLAKALTQQTKALQDIVADNRLHYNKTNDAEQSVPQHYAYDLPARIISFEQSEQYLLQTKQALAQHGLAGFVELVLAPLVPTDQKWPDDNLKSQLFYDCQLKLQKLAEIFAQRQVKILVVVDGPCSPEQDAFVRYPALPVLLNAFSAHKLHIVLDDSKRRGEQQVVAKWGDLLEQRGLSHSVKNWPTAKGAVLIEVSP